MALLALLEVFLRSLSELLPVMVDFVTSALILLLPLVNERPVLLWLLGWLFLGSLAYRTCFTMDTLRIGHNTEIAFRRLLDVGAALLAVAFAIVVKRQIFTVAFGRSATTSVVTSVFDLFGIACLVYLALAVLVVLTELSKDGSNASLLAPIALLLYELPRTLFLGPALAIAAALYPLPETAVLVWGLAAIGVNTVPYGPRLHAILNDPIERFAIGAAAARWKMEGYIAIFYVLCGVLISLAAVFGTAGSTQQILRQLVENANNSPVGVAFLLITIFGTAVYGFWYWLRLVERLPFALGTLSVEETAQTASGTPGTGALGAVEYRPLPPDFGISIPLLLAPLILFTTHVGSQPLEQTVPVGYLLATTIGLTTAIVSVWWTRRRTIESEGLPIPIVAAVAVALHLAILEVLVAGPISKIIHGLLTTAPIGPIGLDVFVELGTGIAIFAVTLAPATIPLWLERGTVLSFILGICIGGFVVAGSIILLGGASEAAESVAGVVFLFSPVLVLGGITLLERLGLA